MLETAERRGVDDAVVVIGLAAALVAADLAVDHDIDAHRVYLRDGRDLGRVLHFLGVPARLVDLGFHPGGELLRAAKDAPPGVVDVVLGWCTAAWHWRRVLKVERLENGLAECLVVPIGASARTNMSQLIVFCKDKTMLGALIQYDAEGGQTHPLKVSNHWAVS